MKNKKDKIIKITLIIIIILLLIHNCTLIKKKGKEKTPSGNVNIIEIICENSDKCDIKDKDSKKTSDDTNDDNSDTSNNKNSVGSNNSTTGTNKKSTDTNKKNADNTSPTSDTEETSDDQPEELTVLDSDITWKDTTELKIFENSMYNLDNVVAPESSNTYEFVVKNSTKYNVKYNINFIETNPYHINMKYKLKKNDTYLVDHYVSYNELNINEQVLNAKKNDTFYLEWKWVSSDNDNAAGENKANYNLKIEVKAESI